MAAEDSTRPILELGSLVKILNSGFDRAKIVEYRGELGPNRARIYRVMYRRKPTPAYTEVREDQLEVIRLGDKERRSS